MHSLNQEHSAQMQISFLAIVSLFPLVATPTEADELRPERHYIAIIKKNCLRCHIGPDARAGLDLSTRARLLRGGDSGPAAIPGAAEQSLLLQRVTEGSMPPINDGPQLDAKSIESLSAWIQLGAPWTGPALKLISDAPCSPRRRRGRTWRRRVGHWIPILSSKRP